MGSGEVGAEFVSIAMESTEASSGLYNGESERSYISCPASRIFAICSGNVSIVWPGVNQVALMLYFSYSARSRSTPRVAPNTPVEISYRRNKLVRWSLPRDTLVKFGGPPTVVLMWFATASTSRPYPTRTLFLPILSFARSDF